jgi:hypothetical protein
MDGDLQLHAIGEAPVLCWETGCMQLDLDEETASLVERPPAASAWLEPLAEVKTDSVCVGTTCKKLGEKLVAAVAKVRNETVTQYTPKILATANLETVVIGPTAWSVDRDRRIKLAAPPGIKPPLGKNTYKPLEVIRIDVAGDLLLVHWSNCVDDFCMRVQLTDGAGRAIGAHREGGGLAPIQLDDTNFVIVSDRGSVQVYNLESREIEVLPLDARPFAAVRIDRYSIAMLFQTFADPKTVRVATILRSVEPYVRMSMALPHCR